MLVQPGDPPIQRRQIADVFHNLIRQRQPLAPVGLGRQDTTGLCFVDAIARHDSTNPRRFRRVHHQNPVHEIGHPGFRQQRNDQQAVGSSQARGPFLRQGADAGMQDRLQPPPARWVGEEAIV